MHAHARLIFTVLLVQWAAFATSACPGDDDAPSTADTAVFDTPPDTSQADTSQADATADIGPSDADAAVADSDSGGPQPDADVTDSLPDVAPDVPGVPDVPSDVPGVPDVAPDVGSCDCSDVVVGPCQTTSCLGDICVIEDDSNGTCDDGDPCTENDYCLVGSCIGNTLPDCCTASCAGLECGDDGCGGNCGDCSQGKVCGPNNTCEDAVAGGDTCAVAIDIPTLPAELTGDTDGFTNDYDAPETACIANNIGTFTSDVVYTHTAEFDGYLKVTIAGDDAAAYIVEACDDIKYTCGTGAVSWTGSPVSNHAPVSKGTTYYVIVEGEPGSAFELGLDSCIPDCEDKECGLDGCGNWCGFCESPEVFNHWECGSDDTCYCIPDCYDKGCGSDGCGGSCGTCGAGETCGINGGDCVAAGQPGDTCADAIPIVGSSFTHTGDTSAMANDYYGWFACDGNGTNAYLGDDAPDIAFVIKPTVDTSYFIELESIGFNPEMWAVSDCDQPLSWIQCAYKPASLNTQLFIEAPANVPTWVIVSAYQVGGGPFTLTATECTPNAADPTGGNCGSVPEFGETCSYSPLISLPFATSAPFLNGTVDTYQLEPGGACEIPKLGGADVSDEVYRFTANATGNVSLVLDAGGQYDPLVYVVTDCSDIAESCVAWSDATGQGGTEDLVFGVEAGVTYSVIIDGFTGLSGGYSLSIDMAQ